MFQVEKGGSSSLSKDQETLNQIFRLFDEIRNILHEQGIRQLGLDFEIKEVDPTCEKLSNYLGLTHYKSGTPKDGSLYSGYILSPFALANLMVAFMSWFDWSQRCSMSLLIASLSLESLRALGIASTKG